MRWVSAIGIGRRQALEQAGAALRRRESVAYECIEELREYLELGEILFDHLVGAQ